MSKHFWDQILIDMFSYSLAVISIFTLLGISLSHMEVGENILFPMLHSILGLMLFLLSCHSSVLPNKRVKLTVCVYVFVCVFLCLCLLFTKIHSCTTNYVHHSRNTKFKISLFGYGFSIELIIHMDWKYLSVYEVWTYSNWKYTES